MADSKSKKKLKGAMQLIGSYRKKNRDNLSNYTASFKEGAKYGSMFEAAYQGEFENSRSASPLNRSVHLAILPWPLLSFSSVLFASFVQSYIFFFSFFSPFQMSTRPHARTAIVELESSLD